MTQAPSRAEYQTTFRTYHQSVVYEHEASVAAQFGWEVVAVDHAPDLGRLLIIVTYQRQLTGDDEQDQAAWDAFYGSTDRSVVDFLLAWVAVGAGILICVAWEIIRRLN